MTREEWEEWGGGRMGALRLGMRDDCFIVQNLMSNKLSGVIQ